MKEYDVSMFMGYLFIEYAENTIVGLTPHCENSSHKVPYELVLFDVEIGGIDDI